MLVLPSIVDMPWKHRIAVLEISGAIGVQVKAPEMVRTIKASGRPPSAGRGGGDRLAGQLGAGVGRDLSRVAETSAKKPVVAFAGSSALSGGT